MEKKKVIALGISGISFILAAAITSTVAWYTGSSYLAITNINISLFDPTLKISLTDNDHDFTDEIAIEDRELSFTAVSSAFKDEWLERREEMPVFKDGYAVGSDTLFNKSRDFKNMDTGFYSQIFYLKCDMDGYVTFDPEITRFEPNNPYAQENDKVNDVVKSMRFSVLVLNDKNNPNDYDNYKYFIYDPNKEGETKMGGILDTSNSGYYNTYNHKEILYGDITVNPNRQDLQGVDPRTLIVYDEPLAQETEVFTRNQMTCFDANNAKGDRKVNFELSEQNGLYIKEEGAFGPDEVTNKLLIPISAGKTRKIVLSFYQEGWDRDNTNFIVHSNFKAYVSFMIAPVNPWA